MNYRNEWPNISGKFITTAAAYDQRVDALRGGLGLMFVNVITLQAPCQPLELVLSIPIIYKRFRKFNLNFGIEGSYYQKAIDWDKLIFGDMIDSRRGFVYQTSQIRMMSQSTISLVQVVGYTENFYFGFAAHHLTSPDESLIDNVESPLPMKLTGHAGAVIPRIVSIVYRQRSINFPNILFVQQGSFTQINVGMYVKKGVLVGGVWYRNRDAFILTFGIESDLINVGYSYDVTMSQLVSCGFHEISLGINFSCKLKKKQFRTISCPSF